MAKKRTHNTWGIFIGLIVGSVLGIVFNYLKTSSVAPITLWITDNIFYPVGNAFLQSLFMIIVPLVFSSLIVGVGELGAGRSVGKLSRYLLTFYLASTFIAIGIGQIYVNTIKPGVSIEQSAALQAAKNMRGKLSSLEEKSSFVGSSLWPGLITKIIPRNIIDQFGKGNMLAVIFVSLLFGMALIYLPNGPPKQSFINVMSALTSISITIIDWIMRLAPYAVAALIAVAVSEFGAELMKKMAVYIAVMVLGMLTHLFVTYGLFLKFLVRIPIREFFKRIIPILTTSFSTSSSSATMPVTMNVLEKNFGIPKSIVNFSIPIGTIVNMDGTALFEVVAVVFIAQIFGVDLSLTSHILLILIVLITSIGVAGVPGGSLPILMSAVVVLGLPAEGIAIILGVDRLLDMGRTTVNVTGDSIATLYLAKKENININENIKQIPC